MANLANAQNTMEILRKYDFRIQKKYGQNFLVDPGVPEKIIRAAELTKDDFVLEIGPGIGTLTQYLAEAAGEVVSVEIDRLLIPILSETMRDYPNVTVVQGDILKVDLEALTAGKTKGRPLKVVANLPYYITTPILLSLFEGSIPLESITVMVQKEIADRMQAGPGSKDYGALSLVVQYYSEVRIAAHVPPNCFLPRPTVESAVLSLKRRPVPPVACLDEALLFRVIRAAFNQRRKTLKNALANAEAGFEKETVGRAIERLGWDESVRGEALTLSEFALLTDALVGVREENPAG